MNLHLLFWLSLIPFAPGWMGEHYFAPATMMLYGVILLTAAIAYNILQRQILRHNGKNSLLSKAIGGDFKGKVSIVLYAVALAFLFTMSEYLRASII